MSMTSNWKRETVSNRIFFACSFVFPKSIPPKGRSRMTDSLLSSRWPVLGTFALLCPFQAHLLPSCPTDVLYGRALSLHSCWAEHLSLGLYVYVTLHFLLSCSALNLLPITCTLMVLSWFFSFTITQNSPRPEKKCVLFSCGLVWGCFVFFQSSVSSASSAIVKDENNEAVELVLCVNSTEKLKYCALVAFILVSCIMEKLDRSHGSDMRQMKWNTNSVFFL